MNAGQRTEGRPDQGRSMPLRTIKCDVCGETFETKGCRTVRCDECARLVANAWACVYKKMQALGIDVKNDKETTAKARKETIERVRRKVLAEKAAAAKTAAKAKAPKEKHPCPRCGHVTTREYCNWCRRSGMDNVHRVTGKTTGWDKAASEPAADSPANGGWRGRKVTGGGGAACGNGWYNAMRVMEAKPFTKEERARWDYVHH